MFGEPIKGTKPMELSDEQAHTIVNQYRAGRDLMPSEWPGGARVAVLFSIDVDNETPLLSHGVASPSGMSISEYGGRRGLVRLTNLFDQYHIPITYFMPAISLKLAPEMADVICREGHHEVALHGWIHEEAETLSEDQHRDSLKRSLDYLEQVIGQRPVGYRAPSCSIATHTAQLLQEMDLLYDSSFFADDSPYELNCKGKPTGLIELPLSFNTEDSILITTVNGWSQTYAPRDVLQIYKDEFDAAYREGGMMVFALHPHVSGPRAQSMIYEELIEYMKTKEGVWFGTHQQAAEHIKKVSCQ